MLKYYSCLLISLILAATAFAVPNYWDPKNIIHASDQFWSFGLTKDGLIQLQKFPTARNELWKRISTSAREFKKHANQRIAEKSDTNQEEANAYKQAIAIIDSAEQEARNILAIGLSSHDIDTLNNIIDGATPEEILQFDQHSKRLLQALKTPLMGGSRFEEQIPLRITLETKYTDIKAFLKNLSARDNLSQKDRALIQHAQEALETAYHDLHQYVKFS